MNEAERFFYENAGWSYHPATETEEEGRQRCARDLAAAERRLMSGPYYTTTDPDPEERGAFIVTLWSVDKRRAPLILGSIGGVEEDSDAGPYIRVIAAELASEYIPS